MKKNNKLVIGLMSGTSADGIDAALVEIASNGIRTKVKPIAFHTYPYPKEFKQFLLKNSDSKTAKLDDVTRLNFLIGELFANAALAIVKKANVNISNIDLVGSHGQTIHHLPKAKKMFGKNICATMQIGEPAVIAKRTGIITVGDFRVADVAVGGSGAPLIPYIDYLLFRSVKKNRALLNIGGIANVTIIPANCTIKEMFAFDTGPGNMLVDNLMNHFYNKPFDKNGKTAQRGKIIPLLLTWTLGHSYLKKNLPKSTGREMFGAEFASKIISKYKNERSEDIINTVTEFTALSIYESYLRFIRKKVKIDELIISGGGVHNTYLMNLLQRYFNTVSVKPIDEFGISSDAKEAIAFAILANETIAGNPANVPSATGAKRATVLGKICLP